MNSVELRNIDALIAEEVYKTRIAYRAEDDELVFYDNPKIVPFWSTNISCAWDLIKRFQENHYIDVYWDAYAKDWTCKIEHSILPIAYNIECGAETAPLAICKAVLKLHEKA